MNSNLVEVGSQTKGNGDPLAGLMSRVRKKLIDTAGIGEMKAAIENPNHPFWGYIGKAGGSLSGPMRKMRKIMIDKQIEHRHVHDCFRNPEVVFRRDRDIDDAFNGKLFPYLGPLTACELCTPASYKEIAGFVVQYNDYEKVPEEKVPGLFIQRVHDVTVAVVDNLIEQHRIGQDVGLIEGNVPNIFFLETKDKKLAVLEVAGKDGMFYVDVNRFEREFKFTPGTNVFIFNYPERD